MPSEIVMPRLGWTMEVGRVVEWLKADGDEVTEGDLILAIESDKAVTEVEALDSGVLRIPPDPQIGVELPVGAPLGFITAPGEDAPFATALVPPSTPDGLSSPVAGGGQILPPSPMIGRGAGGDGRALPAQSPPSDFTSHPNGASTPTVSPRARRVAADLGVDWTTLTGSGSSGRIREIDVRSALAAASVLPPSSALIPPVSPRATPGVRRMAADAGVDLTTVAPGRPGGRVTRADILAASSVLPPSSLLPPPNAGDALSPVRRVIVQRMTESARTVAPVTLTTDADAGELVRLRTMLTGEAAEGEVVPSYTDLIARLTALALLRHPALNASLVASGDNLAIVRHAAIHMGIAVDTERGLLVPVVRDADRKSAFDIAAESADLIARTRAGTAQADALGGSTFTITNLGMFDIDAFTPIINLPECAILGLGRIVARAVVVDEEAETIAVRKRMALSLTFDHRVVDGAPAARFLQDVRRSIERPVGWLMR